MRSEELSQLDVFLKCNCRTQKVGIRRVFLPLKRATTKNCDSPKNRSEEITEREEIVLF